MFTTLIAFPVCLGPTHAAGVTILRKPFRLRIHRLPAFTFVFDCYSFPRRGSMSLLRSVRIASGCWQEGEIPPLKHNNLANLARCGVMYSGWWVGLGLWTGAEQPPGLIDRLVRPLVKVSSSAGPNRSGPTEIFHLADPPRRTNYPLQSECLRRVVCLPCLYGE